MELEETTVQGDHSDTEVEIEPIDLHVCHGKILVWNAYDVQVLREVHHIVGSLIGSLPRAPRQNTQMGLPLQLIPEEANVLLEYGAARLVAVRTAHKPNSADAAKFEEERRQSFRKQNELWHTKKVRKKEELAHIIEVGRMSRKQRRAEKARKKKMKQEAAKAKLQAEQESVRREPDPQEAIQRVHHNVTEHSVLNSTNLTQLPESAHDKNLQHEKKNTDIRETTCLPSKDNQYSNVPGKNESHRKQSLCTDTKTQDHEVDMSLQCGQDERTCNNVRSPQSEGTAERTSGQVESSQIESEVGAERTSKKTESAHMECEVVTERTCTKTGASQVDCEISAERTCMETGTSQIDSEIITDRTYDEAGTSQMECEDNSKKINKQNVNGANSDHGCLIQLFTGTPSIEEQDIETPDWDFPETPHEVMKCRVFQNFWEQGYYLTSGSKFGGDFLAYPGDPFLFHSYYIIVCLPYKKTISPLDIVSWGRMASNVKKTVVLCSVDEADEVVYTSVQWTGIT